MLNLQSAEIKSKTKDNTGYHVHIIQPPLVSLRSTNTRQANRVKASELEFDEVRESLEGRR